MAKWLQGAIKRPGSATEYCKRHGFGGVTMACIQYALKQAKKTKDSRLRGRMLLAKRLKYGDLAKAKK